MALAKLDAQAFTKDQVAIAISHSPMGSGHLGLGFHSSKNGPQVLHLATHRTLVVEEVPVGLKACWGCEPLPVPPLASKQLVAIVRVVASRMPHISYGIDFIAARGSFDSRGQYNPPKGSTGLTCASFVLEVLLAGGVRLVKLESWRQSELNVRWAEGVCSWLKSQDASEGHISAVRASINGLRLRPFEVSGAIRIPAKEWPVDFDSVQSHAVDVESDLNQLCPKNLTVANAAALAVAAPAPPTSASGESNVSG